MGGCITADNVQGRETLVQPAFSIIKVGTRSRSVFETHYYQGKYFISTENNL